jgi:polyadenylate-binding protein
VCFKKPEDAEKALEALNKKPLENGQFLIVNQFISKRENELQGDSKISPISQNLTKTFNSNVFIKFIPSDVTEEELRKTFGEAGSIISVKIKKSVQTIQDVEYSSYQYGYILYEKVEEAQQAIKKFDNSSIFGSRPLKVELWQSKGEIEQEKKQRENRELNSIMTALIR